MPQMYKNPVARNRNLILTKTMLRMNDEWIGKNIQKKKPIQKVEKKQKQLK